MSIGGHLVRRFFTSLWPGGPSPTDEQWAKSWLSTGERELWRQMSGPDRRHAVSVARRLGEESDRAVVAAALLHDVGKIEARLGTFGRVVATLAGRRLGGRFQVYLDHPAIGARRLAAAGSDPLTITWAGEHHMPARKWTLPAAVAHRLKAADDD